VRFEVSTRALAPDLETIAPVRGWGLTREQSIEYAERYGIPITVTKASPYSIDQNLWGRTIECGILEDPWEQPPEEVYELTTPTATGPTELTIRFEEGLPVALDGKVIALAAGFSIATGLFFGYYPARKASLLDPIEALRQQ